MPATAAAPSRLPILGHASQLRGRPLDFLLDAVQRCGDAVALQPGPSRALLVAHPDMVRDVLTTNARVFVRGRQADRIRHIVGLGLVTSSGELHRRQRRLTQPAFHPERITAHTQMISDTVAAWSAHWQPGDTLDMAAALRAITLRTVTRALFGSQLTDRRVEEITQTTLYTAKRMAFRILTLPAPLAAIPLPGNWRYPRAVAQLKQLINTIVAEHRTESTDRGDLLSAWLRARDDDTNQTMTDQQLTDEAITMLTAGSETTAAAVGWTLYLLALDADVEGRLHTEVSAAAADGALTPATIRQLPYLRQVLTESMRVWPPVWLVTRRATANTTIGGVPVAKDTNVWVSPWVLHRDPRWYPNPEVFDPDRWKHEPAFSAARHAYQYLPFGAGSHRCIGEPFAWAEAAIILATLTARWRFRLAEGAQVRPRTTAVLAPDGLRMTLDARHPH